MGLITEKVRLSLSGKNLKYYSDLGYIIPKEKEAGNKYRIIDVFTSDLPNGSNVLIDCMCDGICGGTILENISWCDYVEQVKDNGNYYCQSCAMKLYASKNSKLTRLKNGLSFENLCINKNRKDVLDRWDYELNKDSEGNIIYPSDVNSQGNIYIYLKCPYEIHPSERKNIGNFNSGHDGSVDCKMCNSLGQKFPISVILWSDNNEQSPFYYSWGTRESVWWKCPENKHDDYERSISDSSRICNFRCPECTQERDESFLQELVRNYLNFIKEDCCKYGIEIEIIREYDRDSLICINPKTKRKLPYDNEIISDNFKLIIEVNGFQHYSKHGWSNLSDDAEESLKYIQWKDQYKMDYALSQGYYYLAIPYWAEKDGSWKQLIDDKLQEIYNDLN